MNSILIVLPILTLLMFCLGLTLEANDFLLVIKRGKAVLGGLAGQLLMPAIALVVAMVMHLDPIFTIGLVLIACCPGGSSSNIFSMLAKGDVARFNAVYEEYKRSPKATKERIYLETMAEIFGSETKPELIDSELENLVPVKNLKD